MLLIFIILTIFDYPMPSGWTTSCTCTVSYVLRQFFLVQCFNGIIYTKKTLKINLEHNSLEVCLEDHVPCFLWVICRWTILIFAGCLSHSFTLQKKGGDYIFTLLTCKEFYNYSPRSAGLSCNFLWDKYPHTHTNFLSIFFVLVWMIFDGPSHVWGMVAKNPWIPSGKRT